MPVTQEYLLTFDLDDFRNQVSGMARSYTELGGALREMVANVTGDVSVLQQATVGMSASLANMLPQMDRSKLAIQGNLESTVRDLSNLSRQSESVANNLTRLRGIQIGPGTGGAAAPPQLVAAGVEAQVTRDMADIARSTAAEGAEEASAAQRFLKKSLAAYEASVGRITEYVKQDLQGAVSSIKGLVQKIPGVGGGIGSTLINMMVLGKTEQVRRAAQRGEMRNVFEATGEQLFGRDSLQRTVNWFSQFQERAQFFYGITREQTQDVVRQMVQAGYKGDEIAELLDADLKKVGSNAAIATLALDAHLDRATGSSMRDVINIVAQFGDSLDEASTGYLGIAFAAQESQMGIDKFINSVMSGSSAMQQYGIDVKNVASILMNVEEHYKRMGLHPQHAGERASRFVSNLTGALANLDQGSKAVLAQRMFPDLGAAAALVKLEEGAKRVAEGQDAEFASEYALQFRQWAMEGRQRPEAILFAQHKGLNYQTAADLMDIGDQLAKHNDFSKLSGEQQKRLIRAFQTEGQRVSSLEKTERSLIYAVSQIGRGLMKILAGILAILTIGITSVPRLVGAAIKSPTEGLEELKQIGSEMKALSANIGLGFSDMVGGATKVPGILHNEFKGVFDPIIQAFQGAPDPSRKGTAKTIAPVEGGLGDVDATAQANNARIRDVATQGTASPLVPEPGKTGDEPHPDAQAGRRPNEPTQQLDIKSKRSQKLSKTQEKQNSEERRIVTNKGKDKVRISGDHLKQMSDRSEEQKLPQL